MPWHVAGRDRSLGENGMRKRGVDVSGTRPDTWIPAGPALEAFDAIVAEGGNRSWDAARAREDLLAAPATGGWIRYRDATSAMARHRGAAAVRASTVGMDRIKARWLRARVSMAAPPSPVPGPRPAPGCLPPDPDVQWR